MAERLKQIWSGFEGVTTRRLTGRGVENIAVPHRQDWQAEEIEFLPENFEAPSAVAFSALKKKLAKKEKKFAKRNRRRGETAEMTQTMSEPAYNGEMQSARNLVRGLMSTEARIARSDIDYEWYLASQPQRKTLFGKPKAPKAHTAGKRKKFLGIF